MEREPVVNAIIVGRRSRYMVSKARRSEITKSAWRKRKRVGGIGTCYYCERIVYVGGKKLAMHDRTHIFHKTCYYSWKARR